MRLRSTMHVYETASGGKFSQLSTESPIYRSARIWATVAWIRDNVVRVHYLNSGKSETLYF
jgi:hypothetical protein